MPTTATREERHHPLAPRQPTLIHALLEHHTRRGSSNPTEQLLRYRDGSPITTRRYDHLWHRIGTHLPRAAKQGITTHWLRHTTLTWVERYYAIAHTYAGHHDRTDTTTSTYLHADLHDLATALAALTGQPHPLAHTTTTSPPPPAHLPRGEIRDDLTRPDRRD